MITKRRPNQPNEEVRSEGDAGFVGVNMKLAPDKLPPGFVSLAVNQVFNAGVAEPRGGAVTPAHFNPLLRTVAMHDVDHLLLTLSHTADDANAARWARMTWVTPDITLDPVFATDPFVRNGSANVAQVDLGGELLLAIGPQDNTPLNVNDTQTIYVGMHRGRSLFGSAQRLEWTLAAIFSSTPAATILRGWMQIVVTAYTGGTVSYTGGGTPSITGGVVAGTTTFQIETGGATSASPFGVVALLSLWSEAGRTVSIGSPLAVNAPGSLSLDPIILAAGRYSDLAGLEWTLLATPDTIWKLRDGFTPEPFAAPVTIETPGEFVQFANRVLLFRGTGEAKLVWDGDGEWAVLTSQDAGDGTNTIPNADTGEVISNRLALIDGDSVILTDILDAEHYDPVVGVFAINQGANDALVRVLPFTSTTLLCFKTRSILLLENVADDLSSVVLTEVNREIGLAARRAVAQVGAEVFFLARTGVFRVSQVVESRFAASPVAVSDPIEPFFRDRVNWAAIEDAVALVAGEYFHLALPIDGSTTNNALLCYNLTTQAWEGWHTFDAVMRGLDFLLAIEYRGRRRLFSADALDGRVFLHGEGPQDIRNPLRAEIPTELLTRGYALAGGGFKTFTGAEVTVQTSRPQFSLALETEGVNEISELCTNRTRSRTDSFAFGEAPYDLHNVDDDHARPGRQDYAVLCGDVAQPQTNGLRPDLEQQAGERFPVRRRGRYAQLRLTNTQGRCTLVQARVEGRHLEPLNRTAAT